MSLDLRNSFNKHPHNQADKTMDSIKDIFKHSKESFERLTTTNYPLWNNNARHLLRSIAAWKIANPS
jgi:hypothetical protein